MHQVHCISRTVAILWTALVSLLVFCFSGTPGYCHGQNAEQYVNHMRDYFKSVQKMSFEATFNDRVVEKSESFTNTVSSKWKVDFQDSNFYSNVKLKDGSQNEFLLKGNTVFSVTSKMVGSNRDVSFASSYLRVPPELWKTRLGLSYMSIPFGYFEDGKELKFIPDLFSKPVLVRNDESGILIKSTSDSFSVEVLLLPDKNYLMSELSLERISARGDMNNGALSSIHYLVVQDKIAGSTNFPIDYESQIKLPPQKVALPDHLRFVNGQVVTATKDMKAGERFVAQPGMTLDAEIKLANLDATISKEDFELNASFDNGQKITMSDAPHLDFEWQDGEIVATTDEAMNALRNAEFSHGSASRIWIVLGIAVVLGILMVPMLLKKISNR